MPDHVDVATRSGIMRQIRARNTNPERMVRSALHRAGLRFRLHRKDLPGKPDIVLPRLQTVVFVHGCFWHQHPGCESFGVPLSNRTYWGPKLARNVARDAEHQERLRSAGWRVIVVWECELTPQNLRRLARELTRARSAAK